MTRAKRWADVPASLRQEIINRIMLNTYELWLASPERCKALDAAISELKRSARRAKGKRKPATVTRLRVLDR